MRERRSMSCGAVRVFGLRTQAFAVKWGTDISEEAAVGSFYKKFVNFYQIKVPVAES
jgi:hypothetical protein